MTADQRQAPLIAAAVATLYATGREDVKESAILAEVEHLKSALRAAYPFPDEARIPATHVWALAIDAIWHTLPESAIHNWLFPIEPVAIEGPVLWIAGPERCMDWMERRYGAALREITGYLIRYVGEKARTE